ncbi:probable cytochrome P450 12a5, mitochondrial [Physella acuta]|uniref:probable cytochrome P450 12a5, mitochondrial n=1 Tax=Physella acuta TaxID=109671 RepID=UPI0027DCF4F3|nr:probable cytochrome P450 12a5, mitochondrial [Physella acuta]
MSACTRVCLKARPKILASYPSRPAATTASQPRDYEAGAKPFKDIPGPGGIYRWPVIGTLLHFKPFTEFTPETLNRLFESLHNTYGPIIKVRLPGPTVMTSNPRDFETVYRNEGRCPNRPVFDIEVVYAERNNEKGSINIAQGEEWLKLRTPINKRLLKADSAHFYLEAQNSVADDFVRILARNDLDAEKMADYFFRYAAESIGIATFNTRLQLLNHRDGGEAEEFLHASKDHLRILQETLTVNMGGYKWFRNRIYRDFEKAMNILKKHANKHTGRAKESIQTQLADGSLDPDHPNLLYSLLSDPSLTDEDITLITTVLYSAGTESTARNLQVLFHTLAMNPDIQERLRAEVLQTLGKDRPLTVKDLSTMSYLKACVKESFRLNYPIPSGVIRYLPSDVVLSGYKVPSGVPIILQNPRACMEYFDNPRQFLPERWLRTADRRKQENIVNMALLPFSHGPRNCPGQRFALQEIYLAAVKVANCQY